MNRLVCCPLHLPTVLLYVGLQGNCDELETCGLKEEARLAPAGGPIFSLALDSRDQDGLPSQVCAGQHCMYVW